MQIVLGLHLQYQDMEMQAVLNCVCLIKQAAVISKMENR